MPFGSTGRILTSQRMMCFLTSTCHDLTGTIPHQSSRENDRGISVLPHRLLSHHLEKVFFPEKSGQPLLQGRVGAGCEPLIIRGCKLPDKRCDRCIEYGRPVAIQKGMLSQSLFQGA